MVRNKYTIRKNNYRKKNKYNKKSKFTRINKRKKNSKKRSKYKRFTRRKYGIKRGGMHKQGVRFPPLADEQEVKRHLNAEEAVKLARRGDRLPYLTTDQATELGKEVVAMVYANEVPKFEFSEIQNTQQTPGVRATPASHQTSGEQMTGTTGEVLEQSDIETKWTAMSDAHNIHLEELRRNGIIITDLLNDKEIITTLTGLGIIKGEYSRRRIYKVLKQIVDYNKDWRKREKKKFLKEYIYVGDIYTYIIGY